MIVRMAFPEIQPNGRDGRVRQAPGCPDPGRESSHPGSPRQCGTMVRPDALMMSLFGRPGAGQDGSRRRAVPAAPRSREDFMLQLYYAAGTCALASHIALAESGARYETVRLDFAASDQRKPDYLKLNPKGRVPLLVTD